MSIRSICAAGSVLAVAWVAPATSSAQPILRHDWTWNGFGRSVGVNGFEIIDADGDGALEIVATANASPAGEGYWQLIDFDGQFRSKWSSLPEPGGLVGLQLTYDANQLRVVTGSTLEFKIWDAASRSVLRTFASPSSYLQRFLVAQIDGDADREIVACDYSTLFVLNLETGAVDSVIPDLGCGGLAIGQLDGDPQLEIVISTPSSGAYVLDGGDLGVQASDPAGYGDSIAVVNLDADPQQEILGGVSYLSGTRGIDSDGVTTLWTNSGFYPTVARQLDIDADPGLELLVGGYGSGTVYVLDEQTGTILWYVTHHDMYWPGGIVAGDLNEDGSAEIVWGARATSYDTALVAASVNTHEVVAVADVHFGPYSRVASVDVEADGSEEILTSAHHSASGTGGRVLILDIETRKIEYIGPPTGSLSDGPVDSVLAVQTDDDPQTEICIASQTGFDGGAIGCEDGETHLSEWWLDLPVGTAVSLQLAQTDSDPEPELLAGSSPLAVWAFELSTGWLEWRSEPLPGYGVFRSTRVADLAGDAGLEVVAASDEYYGYGLAAFDVASGALVAGPHPIHSVTALETLPGASGPRLLLGFDDGVIAEVDIVTGVMGPTFDLHDETITAMRAFDVTGDGQAELLVASEGYLVVYTPDLAVELWRSPYLGVVAGQWDSIESLDADADSAFEIVVGTRTGLVAFEPTFQFVLADGFESGDTSAWSSTLP